MLANVDIGRRILVCREHSEYPVALIKTPLFDGGYYCPYCAAAKTAADGVELVDEDGSVWARAKKYRFALDSYFTALRVLEHDDRFEWPIGSKLVIGRDMLPKKDAKMLRETVERGWKPGQVAEDLAK
jgi:hypothetical protein